ncbi:hypothetical protein ACFY36_36110 [Actinoplanes sp. NPDC000266]
MFRYYISFSHQETSRFGIGAMDWQIPERITDVDDLVAATQYLTAQGYFKVTILAFSLYGRKADTSRDSVDHARRKGRRP